MKTHIEYEPEDILLGAAGDTRPSDPVHTHLMSQLLVVALTGFGPREGDPPNEPMYGIKRAIAQFLNGMEKEGYSLIKSELPAAYRVPGTVVSSDSVRDPQS